ncbi:hypothetical protein T3H00_03550 [Pseudomonas fluorescens]|jgi:hypothetical protein|uniref:hypothetical protein n=1 Tax=Pseudomonas fluorescens TaxID=294 RepID=UPI002ACA6D4D|nr:hypothetical protein [Pseudomonas fluorescens]MDZ5431736.1 hypothetical protein [Pseudomonas fluorescens]
MFANPLLKIADSSCKRSQQSVGKSCDFVFQHEYGPSTKSENSYIANKYNERIWTCNVHERKRSESEAFLTAIEDLCDAKTALNEVLGMSGQWL